MLGASGRRKLHVGVVTMAGGDEGGGGAGAREEDNCPPLWKSTACWDFLPFVDFVAFERELLGEENILRLL